MKIVPLAVGLWLSYLLSLLLVDHLAYPYPIFSATYYVINIAVALVALGTVLFPCIHRRFGPMCLPLVIVLLAVVPLVTTHCSNLLAPSPHIPSTPSGPRITLQPWLQHGPATSPEALILRTMPLLLLALILTAWQYNWRYVILGNVGIALLSLTIHLFLIHWRQIPLMPRITMLTIQTGSLLVVGYFICALMGQLKQKQESLAQANAQLTNCAIALEDLTISRERNRMARELHDTLSHTLSALSVQLETVKAYWDVDPVAAQTMLDTSLTVTRSGLQETRRALKALRSAPLDDMGLSLALREMATQAAQRANVQLKLGIPEHLPHLPPAVEQCIYRVAQEAAANVAHHANAHTIGIYLTVRDNIVALSVTDDGKGFDPQQDGMAGHFGLAGMRERAALVRGTLEIISAPGEGTTIHLRVPLQIFPIDLETIRVR